MLLRNMNSYVNAPSIVTVWAVSLCINGFLVFFQVLSIHSHSCALRDRFLVYKVPFVFPEGLCTFNNKGMLCENCCWLLDNLCTFLFKFLAFALRFLCLESNMKNSHRNCDSSLENLSLLQTHQIIS